MSVATELHHHETTEPIEPKRQRILTGFQVALIVPAGATAVPAAGWSVGDLIYRGHFDPPAAWWMLFLLSLTAWVAFLVRCGQERIITRQDKMIEYLSEVHTYHYDLGERLDRYGDVREINGHHLAAEAIRGNGHARHLHLAD